MRDWKRLKTSLESLLQICQLCSNHGGEIHIFERLRECLSEELVSCADFLERIFDVEASESRGRFTVRPGIDADLDEKRRVHNGLPDLLLRVAEEEVVDLPECMSVCTMMYLPQIGYMLAVQPWEDELDESELEFPNLQFMFSANSVLHFKTPR